MAETEAVINSLPLTVETINEGQGFKPLSPNNLLTTKSKVVMPPPGVFQRPDLYCRQRWRRVQHITNEFWCRCHKEFVHTLQEKQKWTTKKWNLRINNTVLLKEDAPRNQWTLCKIIKTNSDDQGIARSVTLLLGIDDNNNRKRILERPISKLILILEANDMDSPKKRAWHGIKMMNLSRGVSCYSYLIWSMMM